MKQEEKKEFDPNDYPALQEFLPAYLHEDFAEEYESVGEAVKEFLAEASGDEIQNVRDEWLRLQKRFADRPFAEVQSAMRSLGAAWQPANEAEWKSVDEILSGSQA
jgi:contact-dependent growth inhibition (CDI) system CdiI-like immunity protein